MSKSIILGNVHLTLDGNSTPGYTVCDFGLSVMYFNKDNSWFRIEFAFLFWAIGMEYFRKIK